METVRNPSSATLVIESDRNKQNVSDRESSSASAAAAAAAKAARAQEKTEKKDQGEQGVCCTARPCSLTADASETDSLIVRLARQRLDGSGDDSDLSDDQGISLSLSSSLDSSAHSSSVEELSPASDVGDNPFDFRPFDVYSLVVCLVEEMALDLRKNTKFKRFSSDEDDGIVDECKAGTVDDAIEVDGHGGRCCPDGSVAEAAEVDDDPSDVALDLTSKPSPSAFTAVARPPLPPLPGLMPVRASSVIRKCPSNGDTAPATSEAIKHLSNQERLHLRHAYYRVARFLQLDSADGGRFPEDFRKMALRRLQAFLYMYLDEVKKKSPAGLSMFQHSFGTDRSIRQFFRVFLGKSELLGRPVVRQARFATDEAPPQILCRGPTHHERQHNRSALLNNAPYPMRQHRGADPYASGMPSVASSASVSPGVPGAMLPAAHGWRSALSVHHPLHHHLSMMGHLAPANEHGAVYGAHPAAAWFGHHHHHQAVSAFHPVAQQQQQQQQPPQPLPTIQQPSPKPSAFPCDVAMDNAVEASSSSSSSSSSTSYEDLNVQEVIDIVCKLFPLDDKVKGLTLPDFAELYGVDVFSGKDGAGVTAKPGLSSSSMLDDAAMTPSPAGSTSTSCRTPLYASGTDSFPGSPASPAPIVIQQMQQHQHHVPFSGVFVNHHHHHQQQQQQLQQAAMSSVMSMSAWSPSSSTCSLPPSPRCASSQAAAASSSVFMSPPPSSATSSPAPGSPLARSVESQMTRMSLINSGPPPLIPLSHANHVLQSAVVVGGGQQASRMPAPVRSPQQQQPVPSPPQHQQQQSVPSPPTSAGCSKSSSSSVSSSSASSASSSSHQAPLFPPVSPLPYRTAIEEMMASLSLAVKENSMRQVVKSSMDTLTSADEDGDTPLMVACANPAYKNEDLYALVERLKSHPEPSKVFAAVNKKRETALFLAACERRPLVAGYLAETMAALRIPLNQTYQKGNTLVHYLAMWGDECGEVLQYLVRVRSPDDKPALDLNILNHMGRSALHEAVTNYQPSDPIGEGFIKCIQLLLDHGADAGLSDITSGKTPVHIAIEKRDPALLELLLAKCPKASNAPMYNDNRPLHSAATLTGVTDGQQLELVNILLKYGADKALRNKANKLPIELVQQDRDRVKAVLQARARQNQFSI